MLAEQRSERRRKNTMSSENSDNELGNWTPPSPGPTGAETIALQVSKRNVGWTKDLKWAVEWGNQLRERNWEKLQEVIPSPPAVGSIHLLAELLAAAEWRRELLMDLRVKTFDEPDRGSLLLRAQALDDLACVCRIAMSGLINKVTHQGKECA